MEALNAGKVIFFAGGTGHPYFSTDTATVLRAIEIEAEVILLAKAIDGVYDSDPRFNPDAKKFDRLNYLDVIQKKLAVMDSTAISLCMDNNIPIIVFDMDTEGKVTKAPTCTVDGEKAQGRRTVNDYVVIILSYHVKCIS